MVIKHTPILYSFRRCPYAIRARLTLVVSKINVEIREILLRDKPKDFINSSKSKTVPCLVDGEKIIDESLEIFC